MDKGPEPLLVLPQRFFCPLADLACPTAITFVRVKWIYAPNPGVEELTEKFRYEILRLRKIPQTGVTVSELRVMFPQGR